MMKITYLCFLGAALMALEVMGHGSMVYPKPRSSHGQTLDERNRCGAKDPYSKAGLGGGGEYCGIGCMGDACLYYQIGCYAGCPTCSLWGKDLYPTEADFKLADDCHPMEPTLGGGDPAHERELRTHNIDNLSQRGDWTRPNPWRAPGYAGKGNPSFPPCGVNSGGNKTFVNPPTTATDVPKGGPGTDLPSLGVQAKWTPGSIVNVSWALYANHGGGYSYRLCKKPEDGSAVTEGCFQETPLDFVGDQTFIRYNDQSRVFAIPATTTNVGTWPKGSMWRKNPVTFCNCDLGYMCEESESEEETEEKEEMVGSNPDYKTMFKAYNKTNFRPGQTSKICPTGVQFPMLWEEGCGGAPYMANEQNWQVVFNFEMIDQVKIPANLPAGEYMMSWRWDCEETPQVWNSCSDITIG